jgi:hypothetical protein
VNDGLASTVFQLWYFWRVCERKKGGVIHKIEKTIALFFAVWDFEWKIETWELSRLVRMCILI